MSFEVNLEFSYFGDHFLHGIDVIAALFVHKTGG